MIETFLGLAILVVSLFVPGWFVGLAFFARRDSLDAVERIVLSLVLSITLLPLLVLIGNIVFGVPINAVSVWVGFAILVVAGLIGYLARVGSISIPEFLFPIFPQVSKQEAFPIIPFGRK